MTIVSSRLAARAGTRQVEAVLKADRAALAVDRSVAEWWRNLLLLIKARLPIVTLIQQFPLYLQSFLAGHLNDLAVWAHETSTSNLTQTLPVPYLELAATRYVLHEDDSYPVTLGLKKVEPIREPAIRTESEYKKKLMAMVFPKLSQEKVDSIVYAPTQGVSCRDRLTAATRIAGATPEKLASAVSSGYAAGKDQREIAAELRPIVAGVQSSARRVARTESMRVAHAVQMESNDALGDMVVGYQVHATLDQNTRPEHRHRNGTIYYKNPKAGQKGYGERPEPPMEADGSYAFNCRCYLSPVLAPDESILREPRVQAFTTAQDKLVPDPAVYSEWFAAADERRRRLAVGSRKYSAVVGLVGKENVRYEHFVELATGEILPLDTLQNETQVGREERVAKVRAVIAGNERKIRDVATFGFELPSAQPAPALRPLRPFGPSKARASFPDHSPAQVRAGLRKVLGSSAKRKDVSSLVGAPDEASVEASLLWNGIDIYVQQPGVFGARRSLEKRPDGTLVIHNESFFVERLHQGQGLATKVLGRQIEQAIRWGVARIETFAARSANMNGYYTWPRLGYNGKIPREVLGVLPPEFSSVRTILDLYELPGGKEWWKQNGVGLHLTFDLQEGSRSRKVHEEYLREKGYVAEQKKVERLVREEVEDRGFEVPDLSDEDEAALDRVWDRIVAAKQAGKPII